MNSVETEFVVKMSDIVDIIFWIDNIVEELRAVDTDVSFCKSSSSRCLNERFVDEIRKMQSEHLETDETSNKRRSADIEIPIPPHVREDSSIHTTENVLQTERNDT